MRETGTGQQVVQLHDRYMMMMIVYKSSASTASTDLGVSCFVTSGITQMILRYLEMRTTQTFQIV
jgi:hypothetical protein